MKTIKHSNTKINDNLKKLKQTKVTVFKTKSNTIAIKWAIVLILFFCLNFNLTAKMAEGLFLLKSIKIEKVEGEKSFKLLLGEGHARKVEIKFEDQYGEMLFHESINQYHAYQKRFELKKLPKGTYYLIVSDKASTTKQPIEVHRKNIEIKLSDSKKIFKPILTYDDEVLEIEQLDVTPFAVNIKLYDENGKLYLDETLAAKRHLKKRFDFSEFTPDKYLMVITTKDEIHHNEIIVR